jgi:hypothetical protein
MGDPDLIVLDLKHASRRGAAISFQPSREVAERLVPPRPWKMPEQAHIPQDKSRHMAHILVDPPIVAPADRPAFDRGR